MGSQVQSLASIRGKRKKEKEEKGVRHLFSGRFKDKTGSVNPC
jgi:hypothetical protein